MNDTASTQTNILLIGDSISVQYGPYLQSALGDGIAWIDRNDEAIQGALTNLDKPQNANSGDSNRSLSRITNLLNAHKGKVDLLMFNCGLHDIKTDPKTGDKQVPLDDYCSNLKQILKVVREHNVPMFWMSTTLVNSKIHNGNCSDFHRYEKDLDDYNQAATAIMNEAGIPVIDLWQFTRQLGEDEQLFCDHVHYEDWVRRLQGAYLAGYVQCYLDSKASA